MKKNELLYPIRKNLTNNIECRKTDTKDSYCMIPFIQSIKKGTIMLESR